MTTSTETVGGESALPTGTEAARPAFALRTATVWFVVLAYRTTEGAMVNLSAHLLGSESRRVARSRSRPRHGPPGPVHLAGPVRPEGAGQVVRLSLEPARVREGVEPRHADRGSGRAALQGPAGGAVSLHTALDAALTAWAAKLEHRARLGEDVVGESLRFSVRQDAETDDDGTPYLHVVITERTDTDLEGRLELLPDEARPKPPVDMGHTYVSCEGCRKRISDDDALNAGWVLDAEDAIWLCRDCRPPGVGG